MCLCVYVNIYVTINTFHMAPSSPQKGMQQVSELKQAISIQPQVHRFAIVIAERQRRHGQQQGLDLSGWPGDPCLVAEQAPEKLLYHTSIGDHHLMSIEDKAYFKALCT